MTYPELIASAGLTEDRIQQIVRDTRDQRSFCGEFRIAASRIHGLGVFTVRAMQYGEALGPARLECRRTPIGRYLNHSETPSAVFARHGQDLNVFLIRDLAAHREVTIDYAQALSVNWEAPPEWKRWN